MTEQENEDFEEGSWSVFRLPRSHWHCQLSNFDWNAVKPAALKGRIRTFLNEVKAGEAAHLIMTGDPGIGKSHIGVGVYRMAIKMFGPTLTTWVNVPSFCDQVKQSFNEKGWDPFADYRDARRLVVLDDLFGRTLSEYEISQMVYRLIDEAYQNNAAVVINLNDDVRALSTYLKPHEVSRILNRSTIIPMTAERDWRRRRT